MTHSGSRVIFDNLIFEIAQKSQVLLLDQTQKIDFKHNSVIYFVRYEASKFKWVKKLLIEQIYIPYICHKEKIKKIILFGNLPVLISSLDQSVFFHNLLYIEKYKKTIAQIVNQYIFYIFLFFKKPTILVQSQYVKNQLKGIFHSINIIVIKTAMSSKKNIDIPAKRFLKVGSSQVNIIYPSFPYFYKNHEFLINQWRIFECLNIHLWLTCCEDKIRPHVKSSHIHFLGELESKVTQDLYANFQAIINTSEFESLGMYLLEAVAFKVPLISCNKAYVTSTVSDFYSYDHLDGKSLKLALTVFKRDLKNGSAQTPKSNSIGSSKEVIQQILQI
jgi:glycosyltransferase involved in cell wall biosynthesis